MAESFLRASAKAVEYLGEISTLINLKDKASLLRAASTTSTSSNSKVELRSAYSTSGGTVLTNTRFCTNRITPIAVTGGPCQRSYI